MTATRLAIIGVIMEVCYLSFYTMKDVADEMLLFLGVGCVTFALFAFAVYLLRASGKLLPSGNLLLIMILSFGVMFRVTLLAHAPVASDDIYRYVWDGKVSASGINPYVFAPDDPRLSNLHTADLPKKLDLQETRTTHPPLAQAFFAFSSVLFGDSLTGMKFLLIAIDIVSILFLVILLRRLELLLESVLLYAWSPLPVLYVALDGHVDALGIAFFILTLLLVCTGWHAFPDEDKRAGRHIAGSVALGISALARLYPLLILPFLTRDEQGKWRLWAPVLALAVVAAGGWFYLEDTGGLYASLLAYNHEWSFNGSLHNVFLFITGSSLTARIVSGILLLAWLLSLAVIRRSFIEKVFLAFLGFVICTPVLHPWSLCWLASLLVVRWSLPVFVLLGMSFLSNIAVSSYRATGIWEDRLLVLLVEYLPFYVLLVREIMKRTFSPAPPEVSIS